MPRKGRALPLLQPAYDRENLSPNKSQNQIEQEAILAVVRALPEGVRPMILADGASSGRFPRLAMRQHLDYVVRIRKGLRNRKRRAPLETGRGGTPAGSCVWRKRYATVSTTVVPESC